MERSDQRRFFDASLLGLGQLLATTDPRVIYPGHPGWPHPARTKDPVWLPYVGDRGWTAFLRDKKLRTRPAERDALIAHRVRTVNITVGDNLSTAGYAELLSKYASAIDRLELRPPAYYHLTRSGIRCHMEYD